jgi:hypothetical protein
MRRLGALIAILMTVFPAVSGQAQETFSEHEVADTADLRCVIISVGMVSGQDAAMQVAGTVSAMYWIGRLDGRTPDYDMEARLIDQLSKMKSDDYAAEAARCGTILKGRGQFLQDMGRSLQKKGRDMMQQENSH